MADLGTRAEPLSKGAQVGKGEAAVAKSASSLIPQNTTGFFLGREQASITFFRACERNSKCACKNTSYLDFVT